MNISNERYINPFIIYVYSWIIVLLVYMLGWSNSYPDLSLGVLFFLFVSSAIAYKLSIGNSHWFDCSKVNFSRFNLKKYNAFLGILYGLLMMEFVVSGIPIIMYNSEFVEDSIYLEWGIPIVNVIVVNGFGAMFQIAIAMFCFGAVKKSISIRNIILTILPPIICVQRGIAMNMFIGAFCIFLLTSKQLKKNIITIGFVGLLVLYLFGLMGNYRSKGNFDLIAQTANVSTKFEKSILPSEYLWSYLYIASPLANFQYIVDRKPEVNGISDDFGLKPFVGINIIPQTISKRLDFKYPELSRFFCIPNMVVGSTYFVPYYELGWWGVYLMFAYIMFFLAFCIKLVKRTSPMFPPMIALLCETSLMGIFDNMVAYAGLFFQIVIVFLFSKFVFK